MGPKRLYHKKGWNKKEGKEGRKKEGTKTDL